MNRRILSAVLAVATAAASAPAMAQAPAVPAAVGGGAGAVTAAGSRHVVRPGETLLSIAEQYGVSPRELARANGLAPAAVLWPGRTVAVPARSPAASQNALRASVTSGAPRTSQTAALTHPGPATWSIPRDGVYRIAPGDTVSGIAQRFGLRAEDLVSWNGLSADGSIRAGDTLALQASRARARPPMSPASTVGGSTLTTSGTHTVAPGETLFSIAQRYATTVAQLQSLNGLSGDRIRAGQVLAVSSGGGAPSTGQGLAAAGPGRIEIDVSEQRMYVYAGGRLLWTFVVSTGMVGYPTRRGTFAVQDKIDNAWSSPWQLWMPYWLGIYWAGGSENGIHALPISNGRPLWSGYLGTPISYGCIVLGTQDAALLYSWAQVGTPVVIRD